MIALNFIMKGTEDGGQMVKFLSSVAPYVDGIYATATWDENGSAVKIAKSFGANVSYFKWIKDFAAARNYALSQVPKEYEYVLWLDTDDILVGGERIKSYLEHKKDRYYINYNYSIDPQTGEVLVVHPRERIFKRDLFEWKARLHEVLIPKVTHVDQMFIPDIVVNHYPTDGDMKIAEARNIEILELTYKEEENHDPRTVYYLARAYFDAQKYLEAEKMFWEYLAGENPSGWDEERAEAYNYLGVIYTIFKKFEDARSCFHMAMDEKPEFPTWYINLGHVYYLQKDWDKAIFWTARGLGMKQPKTAMVLNPRDDRVKGLESLYAAFFHQRKLKEAFAVAEEQLKIFPNDSFFKQRKESVYNVMRWTEMSKNVLEIVEECKNTEEKEKIRAILTNLPSTIDNAYLQEVKNQYLVPEEWPDKSIAYFCGKSLEPWDDTSLEKGIGGSETAVIQLSRYWAKAGYKVVVFGLPHTEHIDSFGVDWRFYWRCNPLDHYDIFIGWRSPKLFKADIKARLRCIDLHDTLEAHDYTPEILSHIDKIFVKSNFQASIAPHIPKEKLVIIPNGVGEEDLPEKVARDPNKFVYGSSYDRGLESMLKWGWPIIKKELPEAKLDCYYGWNTFDNFFMPGGQSPNPERQAWKARMVRLMNQPGVTEHGRIGKKELMKERAKASVHYYGCTFEEIDCISIRESAVVGCVPIVTDYANFNERDYCLKVKGNPFDKRTHENVAREIVRLVRSGEIEKYREPFRELASKEFWSLIAKRWEGVFNESRN